MLGPTLKRELFGELSVLGRFVRIAGLRFRVIGMTAPKGQILGLDVDDLAFIPVARAMDAFNLDELLEIEGRNRPARPLRSLYWLESSSPPRTLSTILR
ncbi:MAG: ABC transporter permease [Candidatus Zixiibacteriota bacterium]